MGRGKWDEALRICIDSTAHGALGLTTYIYFTARSVSSLIWSNGLDGSGMGGYIFQRRGRGWFGLGGCGWFGLGGRGRDGMGGHGVHSEA